MQEVPGVGMPCCHKWCQLLDHPGACPRICSSFSAALKPSATYCRTGPLVCPLPTIGAGQYPPLFPTAPKLSLGTHLGGKLSLLFGGKETDFPIIYVPKQSLGTRSRVELEHDGGTEFGACRVTGFLHRFSKAM